MVLAFLVCTIITFLFITLKVVGSTFGERFNIVDFFVVIRSNECFLISPMIAFHYFFYILK